MTARSDPDPIRAFLACQPEPVGGLASAARDVVRSVLPDAVEELDEPAKLIGYTYQPGTYRGLVAGITIHRAHINVMVSNGAELEHLDSAGLLEGTGKRARHIKIRTASDLEHPAIADLLLAAAARIPRGQTGG